MITKQHLRRAAGLAVVLGGIAAPGAAHAQVGAEVDAGLAQLSTSQSATGLAVGDTARAGTQSDATAVDVAGVAVNVAQNDLSVDVASLAGVSVDDDLTVTAGDASVVLDDKIAGVRSDSADVGLDLRRGARTGVRVRADRIVRRARSTTGRTLMRTCRTLSRRQARGITLTNRQLRVLAGCRRR